MIAARPPSGRNHQLRREPARVGNCFCLLIVLRVEAANSQPAERNAGSESNFPQRSGSASPTLFPKSPPMLGFSATSDRAGESLGQLRTGAAIVTGLQLSLCAGRPAGGSG